MNTPTTTLVIDGSGSAVFAGLLDRDGTWLAQTTRACAALEGLFPAVKEVLQLGERDLAEVDGYIYCEGPGSILSLRLCAMAIETWRRLYPHPAALFKYNSLQLSAFQLLAAAPDLREARIVSDWKKGAWNALSIQDGQVGPVEVIDDAALLTSCVPLYHLPQRKGWQSPPPEAETLDYDPACLAALQDRPGLLSPTDTVELYNAGIHSFQKWTPTRHRAPT